MKKHLKTIAALTASLTVLSTAAAFGGISASALNYSYARQGDVTYMVYDTYAIARKCNAAAVNVTIPETVSGKPVTTISAEAFKNCTNLKKVKLPQNLKKINNSAFRNCTKLTEIVIPYQVTAVGGYAFAGCTNLRWVTVDNPDMHLNSAAFPNTCYIFWNAYGMGEAELCELSISAGSSALFVYSFGDTNSDGENDVVDAQDILRYYVESLSGNVNETEFESQYKKATSDLNRDGSVGPEDSQTALAYYTEVLSGNAVGTPMKFAHNFNS